MSWKGCRHSEDRDSKLRESYSLLCQLLAFRNNTNTFDHLIAMTLW